MCNQGGSRETFSGTFFCSIYENSQNSLSKKKRGILVKCDNVIMNAQPSQLPWKGVYHKKKEKAKDSSNVSVSVQSQPDYSD